MAPDELEMQIARAVFAEERAQEQQHTIDALVAALGKAARDLEGAFERIDLGHFENRAAGKAYLSCVINDIDAALAPARGEK